MSCNKTIRGRSDKKFCNDYCRSAFNYQQKWNSNNLIRRINKVLMKNRLILEDILSSSAGSFRVKEESLHNKGFSFDYYTGTCINKKGQIIYYCYEYGYLPLGNDFHMLLKKKDTRDKDIIYITQGKTLPVRQPQRL